MFNLAVLRDTVRIQPEDFGKDLQTTLADALNRKYANKIVKDVGLCITLWDVLEKGDELFFSQEGAAFLKVKFRFVVFRPFVGEVLIGKVRSQSRTGIRVSMGFFDDLYVPTHFVREPSHFDPTSNQWYWVPPTEDGEPEEKFFVEDGSEIRFKAVSESFHDVPPPLPEKLAQKRKQSLADTDSRAQLDEGEADFNVAQSAYYLTCSIDEDGLGMMEWWSGGE